MSKVFEYNLSGNGPSNPYIFSGSARIVVTTEDTTRAIQTDYGTDQGFAITGVSGTFNGETIVGLSGASGTRSETVIGTQVQSQINTIFPPSSLDDAGDRFEGLDHNGISFTTNQGNIYHIAGDINDMYFSKNGALGGQVPTTTSNFSSVLCFVTGTRILTARGAVAVEELQVGDLTVTACGAERPVVWIGHRTLDGAGVPLPFDSRPVRILAGAFGGGLPERDLLLSSGHPVLVGDHLVPIMCLINGTSITRMPVEAVTYWHVELDAHDILLAEGLPAESYLDLGSRPWFSGSDAPLHDPELAAVDAPGRCRPVALDGPVVEAERRRLDALFGAAYAAAAAWPTQDECQVV